MASAACPYRVPLIISLTSRPMYGANAIINTFVRQYVHASLQQRDEDQDACTASRVVQPMLVESLPCTQGHFLDHAGQ